MKPFCLFLFPPWQVGGQPFLDLWQRLFRCSEILLFLVWLVLMLPVSWPVPLAQRLGPWRCRGSSLAHH